MRALTRARWLLWLSSCLAFGCIAPSEQALDDQDPHQPGDLLGSYAITGKIRDDSCGAPTSLNAPERWSFEVKLSRLGGTLYWLNGREAIIGDIDKAGRFAFESRVDVKLTEPRGAARGCTIVRRDAASGSLSESHASLSGVLTYAYDEASGSDCSGVIGADGSPLLLPCRLSYALSGERAGEE